MFLKFQYFFFLSLVFISCSSDSVADRSGENEISRDWIVEKQFLSGSDDPFPFAENPVMSPLDEVSGLNDDDIVVLVSFKNEVRVYPYKFIAPFEVVNDQMDGEQYAITYCPVTESGHCADNSFAETQFSLIASGYRYKDNLISFDQSTNTYWSQMLMKCIKGSFQHQFQKTLPMVETSWLTVSQYFPEARVFTPVSIGQKIAPVSRKFTNDFPEEDERIFGIIDNSAVQETSVHVYRMGDFGADISLHHSIISEKNTLVVGSSSLNFIVAYQVDHGTTFTAIQGQFPIVMTDSSGSRWNVFGLAVSGPRQGERLTNAMAFLGSWWAWTAFYTDFTFLQ